MKPHEAIRKRLANAENEFTVAQRLSHEMAAKVIEEIIASGLTLRQVARRIGRSPTYVSHVRNGHTQCSTKTYFELSWLLQELEEKGET
jgi:DNA-binding LacI/PurR family transcriptional regulator